ncbi:hypothetical protein AB9M62_25385 [Bacillales bacterium AN1005]
MKKSTFVFLLIILIFVTITTSLLIIYAANGREPSEEVKTKESNNVSDESKIIEVDNKKSSETDSEDTSDEDNDTNEDFTEEYLDGHESIKMDNKESLESGFEETLTEDDSSNGDHLDGYDWLELSGDEKYKIVYSIIHLMEERGATVLTGPDYFIEALDAFYGDSYTNSEKVSDMMVLTGVWGEVLVLP